MRRWRAKIGGEEESKALKSMGSWKEWRERGVRGVMETEVKIVESLKD